MSQARVADAGVRPGNANSSSSSDGTGDGHLVPDSDECVRGLFDTYDVAAVRVPTAGEIT